MRGGQKRYQGSGRGARAYIEADHHRADDYYLREGEGIAQVTRLDAAGVVRDRLGVSGDDYEAWVEGVDVFDPDRGDKGVLRRDEKAQRFVEIVVNGPKSWSLVAGLHADVSVALDAAQDRAVTAISGYVAAHATTRVGGRGRQRQVPVDGIETARIRHYTTRAGDPHRHIHVQVNSRVFALGRWRGLDSRALLGMQRAINGIGHRAVMADPRFRAVLAAHGYTVRVDGEIEQLAGVVPAMSKRSAQVAGNVARYEAEWRRVNPGVEPPRELLRVWDRRAWNDGREAKFNHPTRAEDCEVGWLTELRGLGVDVDALRVAAPTVTGGVSIGAVDREETAQRVVRVLGAGHNGRSRWNVWDIRGAAEEVLAKRFVIGGPAEFGELAEDVAARALARCVSLVDGPAPDHVRCYTSPEVIALEDDIRGRLAARAAAAHVPAAVDDVARAIVREEQVRVDRGEQLPVLDDGQLAAVRAIAGAGPLVVVEGPAGVGKTDVLAVAKHAVEDGGGRLRVIAPTKKAAIEAAARVGAGDATDPQTVHGLVYQHGFRWDPDGVWSRLQRGEVDPVTGRVYRGPKIAAIVTPGDVVVIDEAGMCDQECFRALLQVLDPVGARLVPVGDRRQLAAVGRGGVLDLAVQWAPVHVELGTVHRFRTATGQRDTAYADLSLRIRAAVEPGAVFDELARRGQVRLADTDADRLALMALQTADRYLEGETITMSGVTNADADAVNEVVRERLVHAGLVDDTVIARGSDGLRIGAGDRVMTRRNDPDLGVANRQTWTVQRVTDSGELTVRGDKPDHLPRVAQLPGGYVRDHVHLAYASTVHAVQGGSWTHSGTSLTEDSDAAGLYVGMSRGTRSNTLFVTAGSLPEAREQFIAASDRNRADLGLLQAVDAARVEMANYGPVRPLTATEQLQQLRDRAAALRAAQAQRRADQPAQRPRPGYGAGYGDGAHQAPRHHGPHL